MVDKTTEHWLQKIADKLDFDRWYEGHYNVESEKDFFSDDFL